MNMGKPNWSEHNHSSSREGTLLPIPGSFMAHLGVYRPSRDSVVADLGAHLKHFSEQVKTRTTTAICTEFRETHGAEQLERDRTANRTTGVRTLNRCEPGPCRNGDTHWRNTHTHTPTHWCHRWCLLRCFRERKLGGRRKESAPRRAPQDAWPSPLAFRARSSHETMGKCTFVGTWTDQKCSIPPLCPSQADSPPPHPPPKSGLTDPKTNLMS